MIQSCTLYALNGFAAAKMDYVTCQMRPGAEPTGQNVIINALIPTRI